MVLAWVRGKEPLRRLASRLSCGRLCGFCRQPKNFPKHKLRRRTIILPQKMVAGAPATLAVLDSAGRLLPNVVVELSGGRNVTTDATGGRYSWRRMKQAN